MRINVVSEKCLNIDVDALVVNVFETEGSISGVMQALDIALDGIISTLIRDREIDGKKGTTCLIHTLGLIAPKRVLVIGLGKKKDFNLDVLRGVIAEACRFLRKLRLKTIGILTIDEVSELLAFNDQDLACAVTEGSLLGLYKFDQY